VELLREFGYKTDSCIVVLVCCPSILMTKYSLCSLFVFLVLSTVPCLEAAHWKLVSLAGMNQTSSEYFDQNPEVEVLWVYDRSRWKFSTRNSQKRSEILSSSQASVEELTRIVNFDGAWIYTQNATTQNSSVSAQAPQYYSPGFHWVSGKGQSSAEFFENHPEVALLWSWNEQSNRFEVARASGNTNYPFYPEFDTLQSGRSYIVKAEHKNSIVRLQDMPLERSSHASLIVSTELFILGGESNSGLINKLDVLNLGDGRFRSTTNSLFALEGHQLNSYGEKIYLSGGRDSSQNLKSELVEIDPVSLQASVIATLPTPRAFHSAIVYDSRLYIFGGLGGTGSIFLTSLIAYDFASGQWEEIASAPDSRISAQAVLVNNQVYFLGGLGTLSSNAFVYHPETQTIVAQDWNLGGRVGFCASVVDNSVYLLGGESPFAEVISTLDRLNLTKGSTQRVQELNQGYRNHSCAVFRNRFYRVGGLARNSVKQRSVEAILGNESIPSSSPSTPNLQNLNVVGSSADIALQFELSDSDADVLHQILFEYSLDNGARYQFSDSLTGGESAQVPTTRAQLIWRSSEDLSIDNTSVLVRITAVDSYSQGSSSITSRLSIFNGRPRVKELKVQGTSAQIALSFLIQDVDKDPLNLDLEYSLNSGISWTPTTNVSGTLINYQAPNSSLVTTSSTQVQTLDMMAQKPLTALRIGGQGQTYFLSENQMEVRSSDLSLRWSLPLSSTVEKNNDSPLLLQDGSYLLIENGTRILHLEANLNLLERVNLPASVMSCIQCSASRVFCAGSERLLELDSSLNLLDNLALHEIGEVRMSCDTQNRLYVYQTDIDPHLWIYNNLESAPVSVALSAKFIDELAFPDSQRLLVQDLSDSSFHFHSISGSPLRVLRLDEGLETGPMVMDGELNVIIPASDALVKLSMEDGIHTSYALDFEGPWLDSLMGASSRIYLLSESSGLHALDLNGQEHWSVPFSDISSTAQLSMDARGRIIVSDPALSKLYIVASGELGLGRSVLPIHRRNTNKNGVSADFSGIASSSSNQIGTLIWNSLLDYQDRTNGVRLRLRIDDQKGLPEIFGISEVFSIDNLENQAPVLSTTSTVRVSDGRLDWTVLVQDSDNEFSSIDYELYFSPAAEQGFVNLSPVFFEPGENGVLRIKANSNVNHMQDYPAARVKLVANDNRLNGVSGLVSRPFELFNGNARPVLSFVSTNGSTGPVELELFVSDQENDKIDLELFYSLPDGVLKQIPRSHLFGKILQRSTPDTLRLTWYSQLTIPFTTNGVQLKARAFDGKEYSYLASSSPIFLGNGGSSQDEGGVHTAKAYPVVVSDSQYLYFWGGRTDIDNVLTPSSTLFRYDPVNPQGSTVLASSPRPREGAKGVLHNSKIYIHGGVDLTSCTDQLCTKDVNWLDIYDVASDTWSFGPASLTSRSNHTLVVHGNKVCAYGGIAGLVSVNSMECFDTSTNSWIAFPSGGEARFGHSAVVVEDTLWTWGGIPGLTSSGVSNRSFLFDYNTKQWREGPFGGQARAFHDSILIDEKIYSLGGAQVVTSESGLLTVSSSDLPSFIDIFDWRTKEFRQGPQINKLYFAGGASAFNNKIYAWAGFTSPPALSSTLLVFTPENSSVSSFGNQVPQISNLNITGGYETLQLEFALNDADNDPVSISVDALEEFDDVYTPLQSREFSPQMTSLGNGVHQINWNSLLSFDDLDKKIFLRLSASDGKAGVSTSELSSLIFLQNRQDNQAPQVSRLDVAGDRHKVSIEFDAQDSNVGDEISVGLEYSVDGGASFTTAQNLVGASDIVSAANSSRLTWYSFGCPDSASECQGMSPEVSSTIPSAYIRLVLDDGGRGGVIKTTSAAFILRNGNSIPFTQIVSITGRNNDIEIQYDSFDQDGDVLDFDFQFSMDGAQSFQSSSATVNLVSRRPGMNQKFLWKSLEDISEEWQNIVIRVVPNDGFAGGYAIQSTPFSLANDHFVSALAQQNIRSGHTAVLFDGKMYVWGGESTSGELLNTMDIYDLRSGVWSRGKSGGTARKHHTASVFSGKIYFFGGEGAFSRLATLDVFDINEQSWSEAAFSPTARRGHSATLYNGKIYVWGGFGFQGEMNTLDVYDIESNQWQTALSGGTARGDHSASLFQGRIYFWGGLNGTDVLNSMDVYDLSSNQWSSLGVGGRARLEHTAEVFGDKIYFWGGWNNVDLNTVDVFHLKTNNWLDGGSGGTARRFHSSVAQDESFYLFGGSNSEGLVSNFDVLRAPYRNQNRAQAELERAPQTLQSGKLNAEGDLAYLIPSQGSSYTTSFLYSYNGLGKSFSSHPLSTSILKRSGYSSHIQSSVLYLLGGRDQGGNFVSAVDSIRLSDFAVLNSTPAGFTISLAQHVSVLHGNSIFFFGGEGPAGLSTEVLYWDFVGSQLQSCPQTIQGSSPCVSALTPRKALASSYNGSDVYLHGGMNNSSTLNDLLRFNFASKTFTALASSPSPRANHNFEQLGDSVLAVGGVKDTQGELQENLEIYSIGNNSWSTREDHQLLLSSGASRVISNQLYLFGGKDLRRERTEVVLVDPQVQAQDRQTSGDTQSQVAGIQAGSSPLFNRKSHQMALHHSKLYVWGGEDTVLNTNMELYDIHTRQWSNLGSGGRARKNFSMDQVDGVLVAAGGQDASSNATNTVDLYSIASASWSTGQIAPQDRLDHASCLYQGKIYLTGGRNGSGYVRDLDVYDPFSNQWFQRTGGGGEHISHSCLAYEGRLYIWGGSNAAMSAVTNQLDIYDIESNVWFKGSSGGTARRKHHVVLFNSQMIVWGGVNQSGSKLNSFDVYDFMTDSWSSISTAGTARSDFTMVADQSRFFIHGGLDTNNSFSPFEIYSPELPGGSTWSSGKAGGRKRFGHDAVFAGSRMVVWGGNNGSTDLNSVDLYDFEKDLWSEAVSGGTSRAFHASLEYGSKIYHWGGENSGSKLNSMDVFQIPGNGIQWLEGTAGSRSRTGAFSGSYDGKFYVFGGSDNGQNTLKDVDYYDVSLGQWFGSPFLTRSRNDAVGLVDEHYLYYWAGLDASGGTTAALSRYNFLNGQNEHFAPGGTARTLHCGGKIAKRLYFVGGKNNANNYLSSLNIYDIENNQWSAGASMSVNRGGMACVVYQDKLYVSGGIGRQGLLNSLQVYDPQTDNWTDKTAGGTARAYHTGHAIQGKIYFWGGSTGFEENGDLRFERLNTIDIYDPGTDQWERGPSGGRSRAFHTSEFIQDKVLFWGGSDQADLNLNTLDLFLPKSGVNSVDGVRLHTAPFPFTLREGASSAVLGDRAFLFGGVDSNGVVTSSLSIYNISSGTWSAGTQTNATGKAFHEAVVYQERIYQLAGIDSSSNLTNTVQYYDTRDGSWNEFIPGGTAKRDFNLHLLEEETGKALSWGGMNSSSQALNKLEILNLNPWQRSISGGEARAEHLAVLDGNRMFVWGGIAAGANKNRVDVYDFSEERWIQDIVGGNPRSGASGCLISTGPNTLVTGIYYWGGLIVGEPNPISVIEIYKINEPQASQRFATSQSVGIPRAYHTGICNAQNIYFVGGITSSGLTTRAVQVYNTVSKSTQNLAPEIVPRYKAAAAYHEGKIYVWGGQTNPTNIISSLSIYDINSNTWTAGPSGGKARTGHSAVVYDDKIFFYGGSTLEGLGKFDTMDIYDIRRNRWLKGPEARFAYPGDSEADAIRADHTAVIHNSTMYVWGGRNRVQQDLNTMDSIDLSFWSNGVSGGTSRVGAGSAISDEEFIVWGGQDSSSNLINSMDIYNLKSRMWSQGPQGGLARFRARGSLFEGRLYFWGGRSASGASNDLDVYDIASNSWITGFLEGNPRENSTLFLANAKLFQLLGRNSSGLDGVMDILDLPSDQNLWSTGLSGGTSRSHHSAVLVDGKAYYFGGFDQSGNPLNTLDIFDFKTAQWTVGNNSLTPRARHKASAVDGKMYVWGGVNNLGIRMKQLDVYDIRNDVWSTLSSGGRARESFHQVAYDNKLYNWGGLNELGSLNSVDVYDIAQDSWKSGTSGGRARRDGSAILKDGSLAIWGGRASSDSVFNTMDLFAVSSSSNSTPSIVDVTLDTQPPGGYKDQIGMNIKAVDIDGDLMQLAFEYSADNGKTWVFIDPLHLDREAVGLQSNVSFRIIWNSYSSLPVTTSTLKLRITPSDGELLGEASESLPLVLNNQGNWRSIFFSSVPPHTKARFVARDLGSTTQLIIWSGEGVSRDPLNTQHVFDTASGLAAINPWSVGTPNTEIGVLPRLYHSSVLVGNNILHWGGLYQNQYLNAFGVYDLVFDIWRDQNTGAPKSGGTPRAGHTGVLYEDKFINFGGEGTSGFLNTMDIYDFTLKEWITGAAATTARRYHSAVMYNSKMYVFGGETGSQESPQALDTLDAYDPVNNVWESKTALGVALRAHIAVVVGNRMIVHGGSLDNGQFTDRLFIYDFRSDSWVEGESGATPRRDHAAAAVGNDIIIFGGWNGSHLTDSYIYTVPAPD